MKKGLAVIALTGLALAQEPAPQLTTADQIAIQSLEQAKKTAESQIQQAEQAEYAIETEFARAHPGWHINPANFAVEKDGPKPPPKK